jgi:hypothetical protein
MSWAMIRRLVCVVLVAGAFCAPATSALAQAPQTAPPGIGVKLLQGPADSVDNPRAHEYIIDHLAPGTLISRQIGFTNGDAQPADLSFYAAAADIRGGVFEPGPDRAANELTSWMTFAPASATVQPGQTLPVTVTISVPADATAGERYAAALGERSSAPSASGGVATVSRVGIRIYLSVGPGGAPPTAFTIDSMTARRDTDGHPLVTAKVHNTGERAVDLSGRLELMNGPSSLSAGPFPVRTAATLIPGETGDVSVALDPALPNGPWDARITLVSGVTSAVGTAQLTFPSAKGTSAAPTTVREAGGLPPLAVAALAVAALVTLLLLGVAVRGRQGRAKSAGALRLRDLP